MGRRIDLQYELIALLNTNNIYYQPPENLKIKYPCVVYFKDSIDINRANDQSYLMKKRYELTIISEKVDCEYIDKILNYFSYSSFGQHYIADGLHHDTISLYY